MSTIRLVLGMVTVENLHLEQLDSGTRNLTVLCIEFSSRDVKLIIVAMLSLLTILTLYYCCIWMIYLLQGLALRS